MATPDATNERNVLRYDAAIATLVGVMALLIGGYTAYEQHQQVRAQVWPILQLGPSNSPIRLELANKGVGPAMIHDVRVTIDGSPFKTWADVFERLVGPGKTSAAYSSISGRVLAPGESFEVWRPHDAATGNDLNGHGNDALGVRLWKEMARVGVEICYCSTLDDCWMLSSPPGQTDTTTAVRRCPTRSPASFDQ